jgi:hypothetical protein
MKGQNTVNTLSHYHRPHHTNTRNYRASMKNVSYQDIRKEYRTLLLIPYCACALCNRLLFNLMLINRELAIGDITFIIMDIIIRLTIFSYENHDEILQGLRAEKAVFDDNVLTPFYGFDEKCNEMLHYQHQFVNHVFHVGLFSQDFDKVVIHSVTVYQKILKEYVERVSRQQNKAIRWEIDSYQYILNNARQLHNKRISFKNVTTANDLTTVHDMHAFLTNAHLYSVRRNEKVRKLIDDAINVYIDPDYIENRDVLIDCKVKVLFTRHYCEVCAKFGHNQYACFRKHCIKICGRSDCEECAKIKEANFRCTLRHCIRCGLHCAAVQCQNCK